MLEASSLKKIELTGDSDISTLTKFDSVWVHLPFGYFIENILN